MTRTDLIDEKLKMLVPVLGEQKVNRLRQMYFYEDDFRQKREIESHIEALVARHVKPEVEEKIILPPPKKEQLQGAVHIGDVEYLDKKLNPFGLNLKDVNRHIGIFGSTGSGKTTLALNLIRRFHDRKIPFMIFDWEKSYRSLAGEFDDVQVFTVGKDIHPLHLNILNVPPGISIDEYIKSLIAILAEDYLSGAGSDTMLMNYMKTAFTEKRNPTFNDLKEIVLREIQKDMKGRGKLSGRSGLWKETVSRIISFLSFGTAGEVLGTDYHYPLDKLFHQNVVLELGGIQSPRDRKFIMHCILNWLFLWLQHHGIESEQLNQVIIFEEFHNITLKSREDNLISQLFRQARKYGLGLVAIDQTPSEIPNAIFANMNTKISFTLATSQDIASMAKAINFDFRSIKYFGMLKTGQAIVSAKQRCSDPILVRVPFAHQNPNPGDEEIRAAMSGFPKYSRLDQLLFPNQRPSQAPQDSENLSPMEKVLMADVCERPFEGVDERTKRLGIHAGEMSELHVSLTKKGVFKTITLNQKKLFEITEHGKQIAVANGIRIPKKETRGGLVHDYWIHQVARFLRKLEFEPVLEKDGIDIVASFDDNHGGVAIEIETGKSDIAGNLEKLKNSKVSARFMLATTKPVELKLRKIGKDHPETLIMFVKDFFKLTKDQIASPSV